MDETRPTVATADRRECFFGALDGESARVEKSPSASHVGAGVRSGLETLEICVARRQHAHCSDDKHPPLGRN